jgi:hypothetical protein
MDEQKKTIEEQYKFIENRKQLGSWFKKNMSWIVIIGSSILFIFKEGLEFSASQDNVITLVMSMGFTYLFALYMSLSMRAMGKKSGKESATYINTMKYLSDAKTAIKDIIYLLPRYTKYKNETSLEDVRKVYIEENGMSYHLYKKGYYDKEEIKNTLNEQQINTLNQIQKISITKLQPNDLLSEHSKSNLKHLDPLYLGKDERKDSKESTANIMITKAVFPIITSYFAIQVVLGAGIIWGAIQVSIILLIGITHYMEGEEYVVGELKNRQINKADLLIEFKNIFENKPEIFNEELEIIKKIQNEEA